MNICYIGVVVALLGLVSPTQSLFTRPATRLVNKPPLIVKQPPKEIPFRVGHSIELLCVATGYPNPTYSWSMDGKPYDPSGNAGRVAIQPGVGTLVFANPLERDEGFYQCNATNIMGTAISIKSYMRVAYLKPFPDTTSVITYTPKLGASLTLPCVAPKSYPKPFLYWVLLDGERLTQILTDDRVTVDMTGSLHIANVKASDYRNGNRYACIAQNLIVRELMQGAYARVIPQGQTPLFSPPAIVYHRSSNEVALRGESFRTMCIYSGNPTPIVSWAKINENGGYEDLPDNARIENYGQTLVFLGVQYDNAGVYQCTGQNEIGYTPLEKSVRLSVQSEPQFVDGWKPESKEVGEDEMAIFKCKGTGIPEPRTVWLINGKKIESDDKDPNRRVEIHQLTFFNVKKIDSKVIQCNVTNKHGFAFTNAYLNVMEEAPVIEDPPQIDLKVAEGSKVNLTCRVYGAPKPKVVWHKGTGEQLTGGRYKLFSDGNLQVNDISLVDAGDYYCTATNRIDSVMARGNLIVRRRTLIQTAPQNVMVEKGTEAKFTCTATTDPDEITNMQIEWKKDGQFIDYRRAQRIFKNVVDNSLTISGTVFLDTGKYTCVANNGIDSSEAGAFLIVQEPPDPPSKIDVRCESVADKDNPDVTRIRAEIYWQPGRDHYAPILYYRLQYNTSFSPDTWYDIRPPAPKLDPNATEPYSDPIPGVLPNATRYDFLLSPYGNYTFRVLARNKVGYSKPSDHTKTVCRTEPDVPYKNPENVIAEGDRPGNLVIFWTPMAAIEYNAAAFQYLISWQPADKSRPIKTQTVGRPDAWHYVVEDLNREEIYKKYLVRVKAKNAKGESKAEAQWVVGYTGEGVPLVAPFDVVVQPDSVTATQAIIKWTHVDTDPEVVRGFFRGYRIQFARADDWPDNVQEEDVIINPGRTYYPRPRHKREIVSFNVTIEYRVRNLPANTLVRLQIRVLNKYYVGPPSSAIEFRTPEGEPGPPSKFDVTARGPTFLQLEWQPPKEYNGFLIGFNMSYQIVSGLNLGGLQVREGISFAPDEKLEVRLTGLKPGTYYRVFLAASTRAGMGETIFLDTNTLPAGIPSAPVFAVVSWNNNSFTVQWAPSRGSNPGSVFFVEYRIRGQYLWQHTEQIYRYNNYTVWPVDSGTVYQVRVVATNGMGDEAASEYLEVRTKGTAPGNFHLAASFWFYGIFLSLLLIIVFMVIFVLAKKTTDVRFEEKEAEIEEHQRQLEAEQAALQMGILNQYADMENRDYMYSQGSFGAELKPLDDRSYEVAEEVDPDLFKKLPIQQVEYPSGSYETHPSASHYPDDAVPLQTTGPSGQPSRRGKGGQQLQRSEGEKGSKDTFV